jgi:dCMP deaminase
MSAVISYPKVPAHWDQRFLQLASIVAAWSKDPSTKVGAVAVRGKRVLATGYNGLPAGVHDFESRLQDRDTRLAMTVHAEQNLVAYAARAGVCLAGATVYVYPLMTCSSCAALLTNSDIIRVVVPDFTEPLRWAASFDLARQMFLEAGIGVERIPPTGAMHPMLDGHDDDLITPADGLIEA